jgi:hypothetical protein
MKVSDLAFCSQVCREAARQVCIETSLPFSLYQDLTVAHAKLAVALEQFDEQLKIEKDAK